MAPCTSRILPNHSSCRASCVMLARGSEAQGGCTVVNRIITGTMYAKSVPWTMGSLAGRNGGTMKVSVCVCIVYVHYAVAYF